MTKNNGNILKAKKELLERQIKALYEELDGIAGEMNSEQFYAADGITDWKESKKKINSLYKQAEPLHKIREYLSDVLYSIEQSDLDKFQEEQGIKEDD